MDERYAAWAARWRVPLGFAFAVSYLIFSQPTVVLLAAGGTFAAAGLVLRAFAAGYLDKGAVLTTWGPYAYTRNPLYLGSFLIGLGFVLAGGSWILGVIFLGFFLFVYWPVMRREEAALRTQFGEIYNRYAVAVPLFFPNARRAPGSEGKFRWERYRKNREYEAALGLMAGIVFLVLKLELR